MITQVQCKITRCVVTIRQSIFSLKSKGSEIASFAFTFGELYFQVQHLNKKNELKRFVFLGDGADNRTCSEVRA